MAGAVAIALVVVVVLPAAIVAVGALVCAVLGQALSGTAPADPPR